MAQSAPVKWLNLRWTGGSAAPEYPHDKWAISVYTKEDEELGYIARFKNETIARLMDNGKKFYAFVDEQSPPPANPVEFRRTRTGTENYAVPFFVFMEDL